MAYYLELLAIQRPFAIGHDDDGRALFSFNLRAVGFEANSTWEDDIATLISGAGLGTLWSDMFIGSSADIPSGSANTTPYVEIIGTGGMATKFTAEDNQLTNLSVQIMVRAVGYQNAQTKANQIFELLNGKRNFQV